MATTPPTNSGGGVFDGNAGTALNAQGITWGALLAAIGYASISAGAQIAAFILLRWRLSRI